MLHETALRVQLAVRRAALGGVAAVLILAGLGLLTVSTILALVPLLGAPLAFAVVGGGLIGIALIVLGISAMQKPKPAPRHSASAHKGAAAVVAAFAEGFSEGRRVRR